MLKLITILNETYNVKRCHEQLNIYLFCKKQISLTKTELFL